MVPMPIPIPSINSLFWPLSILIVMVAFDIDRPNGMPALQWLALCKLSVWNVKATQNRASFFDAQLSEHWFQ